MAAPLAEQVREIWPKGPTRWAEASGSSNVHGLIPEVADMHARVAIIGGGAGAPKLNVTSLMGKQDTLDRLKSMALFRLGRDH